MRKDAGWKFYNEKAEFHLEKPDASSYLYFPLVNEAGMISVVAPTLHGDAKLSQNTFLLSPVSAEDLHNSRAGRNFWIYIDGKGAWSATGNSARQIADRTGPSADYSRMEAGFLWQKIFRENSALGIASEITSFVPVGSETVELMRVKITNTTDGPMRVTPTAAIPLYCRSADNLRDHRHVTSLLHRIQTVNHGIIVQPTFCFDERGHQVNHVAYGVLSADDVGQSPIGFFPIVEDFIGEGGNLEWPETIVNNLEAQTMAGVKLEGYEAIGALRFSQVVLGPMESKSYIVALAIHNSGSNMEEWARLYCNETAFDTMLAQNQTFWENRLAGLSFMTGDPAFNYWMKWVNLQPILRRICGCSFFPHHDYGRGGRGWRDLWQDCLALLVSNPSEVKKILFNNFAGVRIDGSNATIIGSKPGEFIADRNNIIRTWMDHGVWPFLTTELYINQSGDFEFLLLEQKYFKDRQLKRATVLDPDWNPENGNDLRCQNGEIYQGTIIEHILLELAAQFYNVGIHNHLRLESADWNDALDMAAENGESVAFTALYCYCLDEFSKLLRVLPEKLGVKQVELAQEAVLLLDSISQTIDYDSVAEKHQLLNRYYDACGSNISGIKKAVDLKQMADDLQRKAGWMKDHIRQTEWLKDQAGFQWFNGYYNNDGQRVEGDHPTGVRMTLTGQVFTIMGGIATKEQMEEIIKSVQQYLWDKDLGGYRLNTDFGGIQLNLGRAFSFAYGHKENGAIFSHMVTMYANALYKQGLVHEGYKVLQSLYRLSCNFEKSRIYPGLPEYFNQKGRGMYHYLTGSASWFLLTLLCEVYGVKGEFGDLKFKPQLVLEQFHRLGICKVNTYFHGKRLEIEYHNPMHLEFGEYKITKVCLDGMEVQSLPTEETAYLIAGDVIKKLGEGSHRIQINLGSKS
jgi:cellobiose phosphorylase